MGDACVAGASTVAPLSTTNRPPAVNLTTRPGAPQQAALRRTRPRRGRPQVGKGAAVICVSIERGLLQETDRLAEKLGVPRTALIARGLRALLSREIPVQF